ncbi:bifunctional DNA primase/polymerase [Nocardia brasiliensis]|uniref:bifunctional DNA primase/polymerase n=1 Tax=Nocardia brasiliensis TaxID=37326 RepID=UPI003D8FEA1B
MVKSTATHSGTAQLAPLIDHALAYARAGLGVLPLAARGKAPVTEHGKDDATTDPDVIRAWWDRNPLCNIGIRPQPGVVVLDVDPRSDGSLEALGAIPPTWTAATGGGGWHVWFRHSGKARGRLDGVAGVDIKTNTGYLVAPPSVHPSGGVYRWVNRARVARLPDHLRARVSPAPVRLRPHSRTVAASGAGLAAFVAQAQPGGRNHALYWAACRAYAEGADTAVLDALADAARSIGLGHNEIESTMRSAQGAGAAA